MIQDVLRHFFSKLGCRALNFCLLVKNGTGPVLKTTIWRALHQIFGKKLSENILDHDEYLLGIILSHFRAFLEH